MLYNNIKDYLTTILTKMGNPKDMSDKTEDDLLSQILIRISEHKTRYKTLLVDYNTVVDDFNDLKRVVYGSAMVNYQGESFSDEESQQSQNYLENNVLN